jgi:2-keto-4-pentenoate hydratase/2-oxohepta-3-ene-1,7-dioic acid hydratase in catechol pathway
LRIGRAEDAEGIARSVVEAGGKLQALALPATSPFDAVVDAAAAGALQDLLGEPVEGSLIAPLVPGKIVGIGLNYMGHVQETGMEAPETPLIFAKFPSAVVGPTDAITLDTSITSQIDWEGELGVVIGQRLRKVDPEDALEGVFGYTVANDVSARDVQFGDGQWVRGKSLDTFCPIGPVVVTADEIRDPQDLRIETRVNGVVMQSESTADMVFSIAELIAWCSRNFTLEPGDLILTGTPWGCGGFMDPPRFLEVGDRVEVEVERIGTIENLVVAAPAPALANS